MGACFAPEVYLLLPYGWFWVWITARVVTPRWRVRASDPPGTWPALARAGAARRMCAGTADGRVVTGDLAARVGERVALLARVGERQRVVIVRRDLAGDPSCLRQPFARRRGPQFGDGVGAADIERFAVALLGVAHRVGGEIVGIMHKALS